MAKEPNSGKYWHLTVWVSRVKYLHVPRQRSFVFYLLWISKMWFLASYLLAIRGSWRSCNLYKMTDKKTEAKIEGPNDHSWSWEQNTIPQAPDLVSFPLHLLKGDMADRMWWLQEMIVSFPTWIHISDHLYDNLLSMAVAKHIYKKSQLVSDS